MAKFVFSNGAKGALAVAVGTSDTTLQLGSGEGANFPSPTGGDSCRVILAKSDGTIEVCDCTARSGDNLTVTRNAEGTNASFSVGDVVLLGNTADVMEQLVQGIGTLTDNNIPVFDADGNVDDSGHAQTAIIYRADAGGTVDAITASPAPDVPSLVDGVVCLIKAAGANTTTTPTFAPSGLTAKTIVKEDGVALDPNDIGGANHHVMLAYDSTMDQWILLNPAHIRAEDIENDEITGKQMANGRWGGILSNLGTANRGDHTTVGNESWYGDVPYDFNNFTLDTAHTLDLSDGNTMIIRCTGVCTINGTIDLDYVVNTNVRSFCPAGGGGGGNLGSAGKTALSFFGIRGGAGGAYGAGAGTDGETYSAADDDHFDALTWFLNNESLWAEWRGGGGVDGGSGGSDSYGAGTPGAGGNGGGGLIIIADSIVFGASSVINARGANGSAGAKYTSYEGGGGAGGGGGPILLAHRNGKTDNGVTITQTGGTGSATYGDGGDGANGVTIEISTV